MSLNAVQANISLHHLEIKSSDPKMLAEFYSKVMNMNIKRLTNQKFLCEGPGRKIIITTGKNKTVHRARKYRVYYCWGSWISVSGHFSRFWVGFFV